jgi:hypothetical protein
MHGRLEDWKHKSSYREYIYIYKVFFYNLRGLFYASNVYAVVVKALCLKPEGRGFEIRKG